MDRFVRFCLRSLPHGFREKYGSEIELDVSEASRAESGFWRRLKLAARTLADVLSLRWMLFRAERRLLRKPKRTRSTMVKGLEALRLDLKFAARSLGKRPGFAMLALLTLGLGIGAVTSVFSVVNGVLLRPLAYANPARIVILWHDLGNGAQSLPALHPKDLWDYRERSELFEEWTLATGNELILGGEEDPELVDVGVVEANFHSFFGVAPLYGRSFTPEENVHGGPNVAILSHRLWVRRYGSDPGIVGETVRLAGEDHEIVGVLPESFRLLLPPEAFRLRDAEIWTPVQIDVASLPPRNYTGYTGFGRMRPGIRLEEAQQEMEALEAQLKEENPEHQASNLQVRAVALHGDVVKRARPALRLLMAAVGFVLLIACGNVAQLLLARFRSAERELSVRAAMGASRFRLALLVVVESLLLALGGGVLGVLLARGGIELLPRFAGASIPRLEDVVLDPRVLAFALLTSVAAALISSLVPALSLSRGNLVAALGEGGRGSASRRQVRLRNVLIVGEVALSVILLVATGLTIRSFAALLEAEPGFRAEGLLTLRLSVSHADYPEQENRRELFERLHARLEALPGVVSVAAVNQLPLTGSGSLQPFAYDEETARNWESVTADERFVSPGFLAAMGATLVAGREFTEDDIAAGKRYAVIDEMLAEKVFPEGGALGGQVRIEPLGTEEPFTEVVGVVRHVKLHDLTKPLLPQFYFPQNWWLTTSLVLRTEGDPSSIAAAVRDEIRAAAPDAAVEDLTPMAELVSRARSQARFTLVLMIGFGIFAVALASVGLFGVISYAVSQRRVELGIRIALGATPIGIRRRVLAEGTRLVAVAVFVGLVGAAVSGRFLEGFLYGVEPIDLPTYAAVAGLLTVVALLACWVPASRATRVDPARALKAE
jgi:putative ABC transport system permease protein